MPTTMRQRGSRVNLGLRRTTCNVAPDQGSAHGWPRMEPYKSLLESLALERIELNLFRGRSAQPSGRLFGGQVIAQSLLAAYETLEGRLCHSLHCYFIRP